MKDICNCPICNLNIKEERQFASMQLKEETSILIDVEEYEHIYNWIQSEAKEIPHYERIEAEENIEPVLAYGILIPQIGSEKELGEWNMIAEKYVNYAFLTLEQGKEYISSYEDIVLLYDMPVYHNHIPCAMILQTPINNFDKELDFGYTMSLCYSNLNIFDNIINRKFLFCIKETKSLTVEERKEWKNHIKQERMIQIAKELI